jgi:AraC family transcriptional regulator
MGDNGMTESGPYGRQMAQYFGLDTAPAFVTRILKQAEIAVTELKCDAPDQGMTKPAPCQDAFIVALQIRQSDREFWVDGRALGKKKVAAGAILLHDLRRNPSFYMASPFHSVAFCLPCKALDAIADNAGTTHIDDLTYEPGIGVDDPIVRNVGFSLLRAFERPDEVSRIFIDHATLSIGAHIAHRYGGMRAVSYPVRGGLAPWQERRAKEILSANLAGSIGLKSLAQECGLSVSHFSRAFRHSTGIAPHQWLLERRVDVAKPLLRNRQVPLSEVALACGFSDQSHFTRVFTRLVGLSPGVWRRYREPELNE